MYEYAGLPFDSDFFSEPSASQDEKGIIKTPFGVAREVPLQRFFDNFLPKLRHGLDLEQVLDAIKTSKPSFSCLTKRGRWRGFAKDPARCDYSVHQTFSHLEGVVKAVVEASSSSSGDANPALVFKSNATPITTYEHRSKDTLPDAFFLAGDSEPTSKTIAVCGEYQKEDSPDCVEDNIAKITGSLANCIRQDPRRRFVYGFTIDNIDMRLWFCDRGSIVASEPFNFITDHLSLIHFLLSILYADPHQLGWDNTMTLLPDGSNFDITVHSHGQNRTYRTQKLLFDRGSRLLFGKSTRVWQAVLLEDGETTGPPVALKDCWVERGRQREGDILRRIRHDILAVAPEDEDLVGYLFPFADWDGDVFIGDGETTPDLTRTVAEGPDPGPATAQGSSTKVSRKSGVSSEENLVHYRLVLSPAGEKSVENETSPSKIFQTLAHAAAALQLMHRAGWVHRDVSSGNITLDDERARLIDFEFAKRPSDEDDLTIGTIFFKAYEVEKGSYVFRQPPVYSPIGPRKPDKEQHTNLAQTDDLRQELRPTIPEKVSADVEQAAESADDFLGNIPTRYNPLHDLESLWWVALYFLLKREPRRNSEIPEADHSEDWSRERQRAYANEAFNGSDTRCGIMVLSQFYTDAAWVTHPTMMPVLWILVNLQRSLLVRYTEVEKTPRAIPFSCAEGLHEVFMSAFFDIAELHELRGITLHPLAPPPALPLRGVAWRPPPEFLEPVPTENKESIKGGTAKETTVTAGKGSKARRRKPTTTAAPVHGYNLRPRAKRG